MLIVDAHEDLAWNMLTFGRDYTLPAAETRRREQGGLAPIHNGDTLLGWPEYQRGRVGIVFSTMFVAPVRRTLGDWDAQVYRNYDEANVRYRGQLEAYHRLVDQHADLFRLVQTQADLQSVLDHWNQPNTEEHPVGLVILMEGAEGVREPAELEDWWQGGVRLIGPAWIGTRYCGGTHEPGPLTPDGYALLDGMAEQGFALDISHMDEQAALQALDYYPRAVVATHANAVALLKGIETNRHLSDQVVRHLVTRDGVIGVLPINPFLKVGWHTGDPRDQVTLQHVVAQIDYICQIAGDANHVGLGSDFDGGYGVQSVPEGIDTIADLQKLNILLSEKGYTDEHLAAIFSENWINLLRRTLSNSL